MTLALTLLAQSAAQGGEVVAHPSVSLSADEVRDVFLGELQFVDKLKLVPVDNSAARAEFLASVLQTDVQKYSTRWARKAFREGLVAPRLKGSDAEVIEFVKSTPGAVGYVRGSGAGLKVLERF